MIDCTYITGSHDRLDQCPVVNEAIGNHEYLASNLLPSDQIIDSNQVF